MKKWIALFSLLLFPSMLFAGASYPSSVPSYLDEIALDPYWTEYTQTDQAITVPASPNSNGDYVVTLDYFIKPTGTITICSEVGGGGTCLTAETSGSPAAGEYYLDANFARFLFNSAQASGSYYASYTYYSTIGRVAHINDHRSDTEAVIDGLLNGMTHDLTTTGDIECDQMALSITNGTALTVTGDLSVGARTGFYFNVTNPSADDKIVDAGGVWYWDGTGVINVGGMLFYLDGSCTIGSSSNAASEIWSKAFISDNQRIYLDDAKVPAGNNALEPYVLFENPVADGDYWWVVENTAGDNVRTLTEDGEIVQTVPGDADATTITDSTASITLLPTDGGAFDWSDGGTNAASITDDGELSLTCEGDADAVTATDGTATVTLLPTDGGCLDYNSGTETVNIDDSGAYLTSVESAYPLNYWYSLALNVGGNYWTTNGINDNDSRCECWGLPYRVNGAALQLTRITGRVYTTDAADVITQIVVQAADGSGALNTLAIYGTDLGTGTGWQDFEANFTDATTTGWVRVSFDFTNDVAAHCSIQNCYLWYKMVAP